MFFIFVIIVIPTSIVMKVLGKDLIKNKIENNLNSYWIIKKKSLSSMKDQY